MKQVKYIRACDYCGRDSEHTHTVFTSEHNDGAICDGCVIGCMHMLNEDKTWPPACPAPDRENEAGVDA